MLHATLLVADVATWQPAGSGGRTRKLSRHWFVRTVLENSSRLALSEDRKPEAFSFRFFGSSKSTLYRRCWVYFSFSKSILNLSSKIVSCVRAPAIPLFGGTVWNCTPL